MAGTNDNRSRGFKIEHYHWGFWARGTREALVEHGITNEGPFPGDPGEKKTICKTVDPLGREITIDRASKTTFSVYRDWSEDEKVFQEQKKKREEAIQLARIFVSRWPKTAREFRDETSRFVGSMLDAIERQFDAGKSGGYRFHDSAIQEVYQIADRLRGMVEAGGVVMDPELRYQLIPASIVDEVLAADAGPADSRAQYGGNVVPFRPAQTA